MSIGQSTNPQQQNPQHKYQIIIGIVFFIFLTQNLACIASKKKLKLVNKGLTDISNLKLKEGLKIVNLRVNEITNIDELELPSTLKKITFNTNNISSVNNLNLNENLEILDLSVNEIEDINLSINTKLKTLNIGGNNITTIKDISFNNELQELNLGGNNITELDLERLPVNSQSLYLNAIDIGEKDYSRFTNLDLLHINSTNIQDYSLISLASNLKQLRIGGAEDSNNFSELNIPDSVETLIIKTSNLKNEDLATITFPPHLKKLNINLNLLETLDDIELPSSLRVLDIRCCEFSKAEIRKIKRNFKSKGQKVKIKAAQQGANIFTCTSVRKNP